MTIAEHLRRDDVGHPEADLFDASPWYEWGPYLSERAWGTVREDYSHDGDAWRYFTHDHARSRAYRWNEDGLAGLSDIHHRLCLALALWNGKDPYLKERIFGLTGPEGNHGEDAKEYWWYLDATPSHAWLRWRYHYPQAEFPYEHLRTENAKRPRTEPEFELVDTGIFDEDRFWVVEVTYAKASPRDVLMRIQLHNAGPDVATLHVLPTLWFRNRWAWGPFDDEPTLRLDDGAVAADDEDLGTYLLQAAAGPDGTPPVPLFCDNETNFARVFHDGHNATPYPKDGINDHVVGGAPTVNPANTGTKAAFWYQVTVPAGGDVELRLRLHEQDPSDQISADWANTAFDDVMATREREADEFYAALVPEGTSTEQTRIVRQACAGMIWGKQFYNYDVGRWLDGDPGQPLPPYGHDLVRNMRWRHLDAFDVMSMPDPWEYPWFAAWDLAFHTIVLAHLDPAFAKYQLLALCREWFQHPNGALPAYEWNFDDVNPPVHAFAALRVFLIDGAQDFDFLARIFQKLLLNFTWWVNQQDKEGNNLFEGGFLGLDNISPIDRSHLPPGVSLEQSDGTAWMAFYCLTMLLMALVLADHDRVYEDVATKFLEHFVMVTRALNSLGLYDPQDGFFYDVLETADGLRVPLQVRSIAGLVPLLSSADIGPQAVRQRSGFQKRWKWFLDRNQLSEDQLEELGHIRTGANEPHLLLSIVNPKALRLTLSEAFAEASFLSPYGLRSLSKRYENNPFRISISGVDASIDYEPAEATTPMFGGNSNWRGPVWFPLNYMVIRSLTRFHRFLGDDYLVEMPTGSGNLVTLLEAAQLLSDRLVAIYLPDANGTRPVNGGVERFDTHPLWKDQLLFFEYFHGETGKGLGASHQTGWTGLIADLIIDPPS